LKHAHRFSGIYQLIVISTNPFKLYLVRMKRRCASLFSPKCFADMLAKVLQVRRKFGRSSGATASEILVRRATLRIGTTISRSECEMRGIDRAWRRFNVVGKSRDQARRDLRRICQRIKNISLESGLLTRSCCVVRKEMFAARNEVTRDFDGQMNHTVLSQCCRDAQYIERESGIQGEHPT
ncbi:hypothetical protein KCU87_g16, partial [Aureobasidium melanogenum]